MNPKIKKHWTRFEEGKAYYDALLKVFSTEQLNFHPSENSWSMLDVMQHLYTSESISFKYLQKFDFNRKDERVGLMSEIKTIFLVNRLNSRKKYQAPKVLSDNKDKLGISNDPHEFSHQWEELRKDMFDYVTEFPDEKLRNFTFSHPAVGKLNVSQTFQFFVSHLKHHQYQIESINHDKNFPL